jgi:hypothetical protein
MYITEPDARVCRVLEVLARRAQIGPLVTTTRAAGGDIHSVCSIRIEYHGGGVIKQPACGEACVRAEMWDGTTTWGGTFRGSVAGLFAEASYGSSQWPQELGAVYTVRLDIAVPGACSTGAMDLADAAFRTQHGVEPKNCVHREYFLPPDYPCAWQGLATVGCAMPCRAPHNNGACWSIIRDPTNLPLVVNRVHAFGHNLGLQHAGNLSWAYGDETAVMEASMQRKSLSAPSRLYLGWMTEAAVQTFEGP